MTSYEFEKAAKNAVVKVLREKHGIEVSLQELQMVWFAHVLGFKKCMIWGQPMGQYYAEVTYNRDSGQMYVDLYQKQSNTCMESGELDFEVLPQ